MQAALKPLRLVETEPAGELDTPFQTHYAAFFELSKRLLSQLDCLLCKARKKSWETRISGLDKLYVPD